MLEITVPGVYASRLSSPHFSLSPPWILAITKHMLLIKCLVRAMAVCLGFSNSDLSSNLCCTLSEWAAHTAEGTAADISTPQILKGPTINHDASQNTSWTYLPTFKRNSLLFWSADWQQQLTNLQRGKQLVFFFFLFPPGRKTERTWDFLKLTHFDSQF